jgi:hypothetical protein
MIFHVVLYPTHKMLKCVLWSLAVLLLTNTNISFAQQPPKPPSDQAELNELIRRAAIRMNEYKDGFKDLTAEEEQQIEEYDDKGKLKKQRRITADLVIYQSQLDPNQMVEYRDVKSVDGVAVKKREERLISLLSKSAKAGSVKKELDRITRESRRYDLNYSFYGWTLHQGLPLYENARGSFQFKLAGREQVSGHDAIVIEYKQVSHNPDLAMKLASLPSHLKGAETRYQGRLWLDADTAQIRREVREMTMEHPSLTRSLVIIRYDLNYADSRFGFLTPQRIEMSTYTHGRTGADKHPELGLGGKVTFEYGAFIRFAVDSPDASIEPPKKP